MWKDSTARKIILPKPEARWLIPGSVISLMIATTAGIFGFRDGSPAVTGTAKIIMVFFALGFIALAGLGLYPKRKSG